MPAEGSSLLGGSSAHPYRVSLGQGPTPDSVLRAMSSDDYPGCLWGRWFGGGVILLCRPLHVLQPESNAAAFQRLADQPEIDQRSDFVGLGGGWLASIGYDDHESWLGFYDHLLHWRADVGWSFETLGLDGRQEAMQSVLTDWRALLAIPVAREATWEAGQFTTVSPARAARNDYLAGVEDAVGRIRRGDFYQVNLCTRLTADFHGQPAAMFADMAAKLQPAYGALVTCARGEPAADGGVQTWNAPTALASFSPELFLRIDGDRVVTSPIKGTTPRDVSETDSATLRGSTKDVAENVMIVDLMRNDLSRVSRPGTVVVADLLGLEPHPGLWHLVSTVSARLTASATVPDVLAATFPPGSVTGAPKSAAVSAIKELEPHRRGRYTGAAGFFSPCKRAELNVAIRSFEVGDGRLELGLGGGITVDSVPIREWQECLDKGAALIMAAGSELDPDLRPTPNRLELRGGGVFETILVVGGHPYRLADHLARLDRSCRELYGSGLSTDLPSRIALLLSDAAPPPTTRQTLRVRALPAGQTVHLDLTLSARGDRLRDCEMRLAERPSVSWRHKWVDRGALLAAEAAVAPALPYFGSPGVTETSRGNLFLRTDRGVWLTPPLDDDVLPGVTRRAVLDLMEETGVGYHIAAVSVEQFRDASAAFWTSSLSGAVPITAVDGEALPCDDPTGLASLVNDALGFSQ